MSFWSALGSAVSGVGGSGVLGYWDGGWSTYSSAQSRTKYAANKAYEMQQKSALEMPSLTRQGFERAGLNPLLAVGEMGGSSPGNPSFYDAPAGGSALSFDGLKGLLGKEKKEIAKNEVEKGAETNALIREQKENVKEETRGKKIDNDLKGLKVGLSAAGAAAGLATSSALAYKAFKPKPKFDDGWNALRSRSLPAASAKLSKFGKFGSVVGSFLTPLVVDAVVDAFARDVRSSPSEKKSSEFTRRYDTLMNSLH